MDLGLKNKTVIISGATKGIGDACRKLFLQEGATVIALARDTSGLVQSDSLIPFNVDVSKVEEIEKFKSLISSRFPQIDILVNNVGTNIRKSTEEYNMDDFDKSFTLS